MGQFAPIISVVSTVLGTAMAFKTQSDASSFQKQEARDARRNAEIDANNLQRTSAIEEANLRTLHAKEESYEKAKAFASGVDVEEQNSFGLVLADQKRTNAAQVDNLTDTNASQADKIRRQGDTAYNVGQAQADASMGGAYGSLMGGASDIYSTGEAVDWKLWG